MYKAHVVPNLLNVHIHCDKHAHIKSYRPIIMYKRLQKAFEKLSINIATSTTVEVIARSSIKGTLINYIVPSFLLLIQSLV